MCGYVSCDKNKEICGKMLKNPDYGVTNFDNILYSFLQVFRCLTMDGWTTLMYFSMETVSIYVFIYYILLVFIGAFFLLNITLAVIKLKFKESQAKKFENNQNDSHFKFTETSNIPLLKKVKLAESLLTRRSKAIFKHFRTSQKIPTKRLEFNLSDEEKNPQFYFKKSSNNNSQKKNFRKIVYPKSWIKFFKFKTKKPENINRKINNESKKEILFSGIMGLPLKNNFKENDEINFNLKGLKQLSFIYHKKNTFSFEELLNTIDNKKKKNFKFSVIHSEEENLDKYFKRSNKFRIQQNKLKKIDVNLVKKTLNYSDNHNISNNNINTRHSLSSDNTAPINQTKSKSKSTKKSYHNNFRKINEDILKKNLNNYFLNFEKIDCEKKSRKNVLNSIYFRKSSPLIFSPFLPKNDSEITRNSKIGSSIFKENKSEANGGNKKRREGKIMPKLSNSRKDSQTLNLKGIKIMPNFSTLFSSISEKDVLELTFSYLDEQKILEEAKIVYSCKLPFIYKMKRVLGKKASRNHKKSLNSSLNKNKNAMSMKSYTSYRNAYSSYKKTMTLKNYATT